MSAFLPFIVIGLTTGAVYGLAGVGLVLTYKTSGIFNLAYGGLATVSVMIFYWLHVEHGMPWPWAAAICVLVVSPVEGAILEVMARYLEPVSATLKVVATVGLLLLILGLGALWYPPTSPVTFPPFLDTSTVQLLGVNIGFDQITVFGVSIAATAVLYYFFRYVRLGMAMRGVVDNPDLVSVTGENPVRVRRWAWIIGMMFASTAGLLLAPSLNLDVLTLTLLVVQAFGAAAIGYFSSLPLTLAGGLAIGVAGALATKYGATIGWLNSLPAGLPFIILVIVMLVTPQARLAERRVVLSLPVRSSWYAPPRVRLLAGACVLTLLAFVPQLTGLHLAVWSAGLAYVILMLSLGLLVRTSGQISLCHMGFAAIGAAAFGHFAGNDHVPWLLALICAGLVAAPVGALVAIPAIRLTGVFLAIATLGFGIMLEQMFYTMNFMFGPTTAGLPAPRPQVSIGGWHLDSDTGFYYVLLIFVVAVVALLIAIQRGRMGRLLRGLANSPVALETHGATTNVTRVLVFAISAGLAGVSGALLSASFNFAVGSTFASFTSLTLVAILVITVAGDPWAGIIAGLAYAIIPGYLTWSNITTYEEILFGVSALAFALGGGRAPGVPLAVRALLNRAGGRRPDGTRPASAHPVSASPAGATVADRPVQPASRPTLPGLEVRSLSVRFGGVKAVDEVSLQAPLGRITGLVGPNGAGKTTMFNACSGLARPRSGQVLYHGSAVTGLGPAARSRRGLGRTFQKAELFNDLSVRENLALGREASMAGANPLRHLLGGRGARARLDSVVDEAIELTGIAPLAELQAGLLPAGQRRMVELARVLTGPFDMLLLDEPSAGLDPAETRRFGEILTRVARERGTGILLVEHDMALVRQVCEKIYLLDFGRLVYEGTPAQMLASDTVRAAYLGSDATGLEANLDAEAVFADEAIEPA